MKRFSFFIASYLLLFYSAFSQASLLQSGPMLGYSEMMEVLLWVQTTEAAEVQFAYWDLAEPKDTLFTGPATTTAYEAFTARLIADQVQPGKRYGYQLRINGVPVELDYPTEFQTQSLWQWRTDPPDFTVAIASCFYVNEPEYDRPGTPYGSEYEILTALHEKRPDAMIWLGDNTYLREVDWFSRTGFLHRYTHTRSLPELQPLLASTHHYAIWDDHDYGPNDSDGTFIHKDMAQEVFSRFWGNPTYGLPGQGGVTTFFQWADMDFFLLDNRYFRTPNRLQRGPKTILGEAQLEWFIQALAASRAPFKLVCIGGQVLNTVKKYETYANLCPEERAYLLRRIEEENIKGVVFLTGDRHHSELSRYTNAAGNTIYDVTISSLTAGFSPSVEEDNRLRVEGSMLNQHNFAILEFSGPRTARQLTVRAYDVNGKELWQYQLK